MLDSIALLSLCMPTTVLHAILGTAWTLSELASSHRPILEMVITSFLQTKKTSEAGIEVMMLVSVMHRLMMLMSMMY